MFSFLGGGANLFGTVPVLEAHAESNGGAADVASLSMTAPAGIKAGEGLMIFAYAVQPSGAVDFGAVVPSGWTFLGFSNPSNDNLAVGVFYKANASGSEGAVTITPNASVRMLGNYMRISGASYTNFIDVSNYVERTSLGNLELTGVITTVDNALGFIGGACVEGDPATPTSELAGWTLQDFDTTGTGGDETNSAFGTLLKETAGLLDAAEIDWNFLQLGGTSGFMLAVRPR